MLKADSPESQEKAVTRKLVPGVRSKEPGEVTCGAATLRSQRGGVQSAGWGSASWNGRAQGCSCTMHKHIRPNPNRGSTVQTQIAAVPSDPVLQCCVEQQISVVSLGVLYSCYTHKKH